MVDAAIEPEVNDELLIQNALTYKSMGIMSVYFYRGEVVIDKTAPIFRRRKLLSRYLVESASKLGINSAIHFESAAGYTQYQKIQEENYEIRNNRIISVIELMDSKSNLEIFYGLNSDILLNHLITYEEKCVILPGNTASDIARKDKLGVFLDGASLGGS